jgi:hypothetical protein
MSTNLTPLASLTPLQSYEQQNESALQDALQQYQAAEGNVSNNAQVTNWANMAQQVLGTPNTDNTDYNSELSNVNTDPNLVNQWTGENFNETKTETAAKQANAAQGSEWWKNVENLVSIIIGIILIGAGVMSFKTTTSILQSTAKFTAKAAVV